MSKFLDHHSRELKQRRRRQRQRRQRERQKSNSFILLKQQLFMCITLSYTLLSRRRTTAAWNFPILRALFMEYVNTTQKFSLPFSKLRNGSFGFNPRKFRQIWPIKRKWLRSMQFETARIYLLSDVHPEILLPWQRDVTTFPLYRQLLCSKRPRFQSEVKRKTFIQKWVLPARKNKDKDFAPSYPRFQKEGWSNL